MKKKEGIVAEQAKIQIGERSLYALLYPIIERCQNPNRFFYIMFIDMPRACEKRA